MHIEPKTRGGLVTRLVYVGPKQEKVLSLTFGEKCGEGVSFAPDELLLSAVLREFPSVYLPKILQDWFAIKMHRNTHCLEAKQFSVQAEEGGYSPLVGLPAFISTAGKCIINAPVGVGVERKIHEEFKNCLVVVEKSKSLFYGPQFTFDEVIKRNPNDFSLHDGVIIDLPEIDRRSAIVSWICHPVWQNKKIIFVTSKNIWEAPQDLWVYLFLIDPLRFSSASQFVTRFTDFVQLARQRKYLGPRNLPELEELLIPYYLEVPRTEHNAEGIEIEVPLPKELKAQIAQLQEKGLPPELIEGIEISPFDFGLFDYCHFLKPIIDIFPSIEGFKERIIITSKYKGLSKALFEAVKILTKRDVLFISDELPLYSVELVLKAWEDTNGILICNKIPKTGDVGHVILTPEVTPENIPFSATVWNFKKEENNA